METAKLPIHSPIQGVIDTFVAAARLFKHYVRRALCEARNRYATKRALDKIDDRMLKDIGIHRSQIDSVAITPMANRISHHRRLATYAARLATTARTAEFKNSTRRGAEHSSDPPPSTVVRPARQRYGLTNAPWIDETVKIRREDLF